MKAHFKLRELMFQKQIRTIEQVANTSGVHRNIVSRIYNDQPKQINLETLAKLCAALNCSPADLIAIEKD